MLRESSHASWLGSLSSAISELTCEYKRVTLIGFSMGGLICANFAHLPVIDKIIFINTPIYFWNLKIIIGDVIRGVINRDYGKISYYKKSVGGASAKSGIDFLRILASSKRILKNVRKPALVIQCKRDESVNFRSAKYIKNKIGVNAELRYYDGGCHQVFGCAELRDLICADIYAFI